MRSQALQGVLQVHASDAYISSLVAMRVSSHFDCFHVLQDNIV